jgi:N-acetylmuramoyl-L-alanine amidase
MPTVHIENRYCSDEYVVGAAITFDGAKPTASSPLTKPGGNAQIDTAHLADGQHVMNITPANTSDLPVGPQVAENLPSGVERTYRSLDVDITVKNGKITAVSVPAGRQENGRAGPGTNPVMVFLQPIFFHGSGDLTKAGLRGSRKYEDISVIVIHQTALRSGETTRDVHGTLATFRAAGSPHYLVTGEAQPQVIKIVPDNHVAGHAGMSPGQSSWHGKTDVDTFSIGIEDTHKTNTAWPKAQIDRLIRLLKDLRKAYPSIPARGIVGHSDVLLIERDCPGFDFDWVLLEKEGLGMIPRTGAAAPDLYGGFFQVQANGQLQRNDRDDKRVWGGGKPWPITPATNAGPTTVIGNPIKELQTDLRDIGYTVDANGLFDDRTQFAVRAFQQHFFAGSRRALVADKARGKVDRVTAEFIKAVRP